MEIRSTPNNSRLSFLGIQKHPVASESRMRAAPVCWHRTWLVRHECQGSLPSSALPRAPRDYAAQIRHNRFFSRLKDISAKQETCGDQFNSEAVLPVRHILVTDLHWPRNNPCTPEVCLNPDPTLVRKSWAMDREAPIVDSVDSTLGLCDSSTRLDRNLMLNFLPPCFWASGWHTSEVNILKEQKKQNKQNRSCFFQWENV